MKPSAFLSTLLLGCSIAWAGSPIDHGLIDQETLPIPALQEVRYATPYNFTGQQLYPVAKVYLHKDAARALQAVQEELQSKKLGLKIYDGYRPLSVQQKMWDLIQDERYVSNPAKNRGRHTRGTAVDVTLVNHLGEELDMPSDFDDFSEKAHSDYAGGTEEQQANRRLLHEVMAKHGFEIYPYEWWHFDLKNWQQYPVLNISLEALGKGESQTVPVD